MIREMLGMDGVYDIIVICLIIIAISSVITALRSGGKN